VLEAYLRPVERENDSCERLDGLEYAIKGEDRLIEKVAEKMHAEPAKAPEQILAEIPDVLRYTFCALQESYTDGYWCIKRLLEARGCEMSYSKNHWSESEYKGINTRWVTPEGARFELQFHTPESFNANQVTHEAYEVLRSPLTGHDEREKSTAFQREVSGLVPVPSGAEDIPDYRKAGC
jgi:hypothetical protein